MKVKQLIELLNRCPQDAIVMYDIEPCIKNGDLIIVENAIEENTETHFGIDDVLIGSGTLKGFVYLADEVLTDEKDTIHMDKKREKGEKMDRFDRIIEDWIIPLAVIAAIVTLALLYTG